MSLAVWPVDFLVIISCYIDLILSQNSSWPYIFFLNNSFCISLVRQIGFLIHFISVAHCCPLVLIEDITQVWQEGCHIWKYYIIKCYKMLVIFTYNGRHWVIFTKITILLFPWLIKCLWEILWGISVVKHYLFVTISKGAYTINCDWRGQKNVHHGIIINSDVSLFVAENRDASICTTSSEIQWYTKWGILYFAVAKSEILHILTINRPL